MCNDDTILPWGTTAWLPEECHKLRESEAGLREIFSSRGAEEIATPTFELASVFEKGMGGTEKLFRFLDSDGAQYGLRPELTTPAARLFATALSERPLPLRIFYIGQVFRQEIRHRGRFREYRQAGFEIYGGDRARMDFEVVDLAAAALSRLGFSDAVIDIGNVGVVNALLDEAGLKGAVRETILRDLDRRDESALAAAEAPKAILKLLGFGHALEDLEEARGLSNLPAYQSALDALATLADELRKSVSGIVLDIAAVPRMKYYTGMVVQAYIKGHGRPVASGGRYDRLVEGFGKATPATGFSLELERLLRS